MYDARLTVADHPEVELVGKRRCVPELEDRPGKRDSENVNFAGTGWLASADIGLRHQRLERFARWCGAGLFRHRSSRAASEEGVALFGRRRVRSHPAFFFVDLDRSR